MMGVSTNLASWIRQAGLFARTARHLRPAQVLHRGRLRALKAAFARFPSPVADLLRRSLPPDPGWPVSFEPLDARLPAGECEAMARGHFRFLGEERSLGDQRDWEQAQADQLWRYHLHYFEWAWAFATHPNRDWSRAQFARLWSSWRRNTRFGRWDAWSPYVVSLRAWAMCGLYAPLVQDSDVETDYLDDIALHGGFVRANLEFDVGGNHLIKNLKALVGAGVFLADDALVTLAMSHLVPQLHVQVLADGGHFERSPSYHCQVLGDLIDVADLLCAAGRPLPPEIPNAIAAMRSWIGAILLPDGDVPLFNDCTRVGLERLALLAPTPPLSSATRLTVLQPSGYVVVGRGAGRIHMVADVGPPCPPDLPAHAHADCLSFELSVDGRRLVVNSGTSTYETGERRNYERSTAAHNTVEIDGEDQTEVWGRFRAARRARGMLERAEDQGEVALVIAAHDGYKRLPGNPVHRRTWSVTDHGMEIIDTVEGAYDHRSVARVILTTRGAVVVLGEDQYRLDGVFLSMTGGTSSLEECEIANGFGDRRAAERLALSAVGPLPHRLITRIVFD